jgi:hypothetical protein
MRGGKGPSGATGKPGAAPASGEGTPKAVVPGEGGQGLEGKTGHLARQAASERKARATLTPSTGKKVIALKPDLEKTTKGKPKGEDKRFTLTISLSENAYRKLQRLKGRKENAGPTEGISGSQPTTLPAHPLTGKRRSGPYGRARLRAVSAGTEREGKEAGLLQRLFNPGEQAWDNRDWAAAACATISTLLLLTLPFVGWLRFSWAIEEGRNQVLDIKGFQLGWPIYLIMVLAFAAWSYMALTHYLAKPLFKVDFGLVLLVGGALIIILFYVSISSSGMVARAADKALAQPPGTFTNMVSNGNRENLVPAYLMVLMGLVLAFSGLVHLSERRDARA